MGFFKNLFKGDWAKNKIKIEKRPEQKDSDTMAKLREEMEKFEIIGRTEDGKLIMKRKRK